MTVGTLFANTIYRLTQEKKGEFAMALSSELGVSYNTAWSKQLAGRIEIDDAYLGGEKAGVLGRGSPNKIPFIAVVETTDDKHPMRIQLRLVSGFRSYAIEREAPAGQFDAR